MLDIPRAEKEKLIDIIQYVYLVEGQGTRGTLILPPTQLPGYIEESEDSTFVLINLI